jgi:hypothetical protein
MLLEGGITQTVGAGGAGGGAGGASGGFGDLGGLFKGGSGQLDKWKSDLNNVFANATKNANATALAASNYTPNFTPIAGSYIPPQNMQTQQSQMSNLYDYLMR